MRQVMTPEPYKMLLAGGEGEITEKKSRFIATTMPIKCEEDAINFINTTKKKYWDARHNCSAFVIGRNHELTRCSDDGEPAQTAGRPMLDVLLSENIHDAAVVVTRYFGGTLLGTGGLVRAYTAAVKAGLSNSTIITKQPGTQLSVHTDYNGLGKLQYLCSRLEVSILDTIYTDAVQVELLVPEGSRSIFIKQVTEATNGKAIFSEGEPIWYGEVNNEIKIFSD